MLFEDYYPQGNDPLTLSQGKPTGARGSELPPPPSIYPYSIIVTTACMCQPGYKSI